LGLEHNPKDVLNEACIPTIDLFVSCQIFDEIKLHIQVMMI
jgi:hypothetical protein